MADEKEFQRIIRNALHKSSQSDPLPADSKPPVYDIPAVDVMVALRNGGFEIVRKSDA